MSLKDGKPVNKNRSSLDIVREVLSIAIVKVCKTRIMYGANLSFLQLEKYLRALLGNALLSFDGDSGYLTTTSGKEFLALYGLSKAFHAFDGSGREERKRPKAT